MKKFFVALLSLLSAACMFTACDKLKINLGGKNSSSSLSSSIVTPNGGSSSSSSSSSTGGNSGTQTDEAKAILDAAYALGTGEKLGTKTLTGKVTNIEKTGTNTNDVCLTIVVGNYTDMPVYCF